MNKMNLHSGTQFDPITPQVADIQIKDIAHALSMMCRGNGHVAHFYSVAQHSIHCSKEAKAKGYSKKVQLACLLHDASETYIADITRPVKKHLSQYLIIEKALQDTIFQKFLGTPLSIEESAQVSEIDDSVLQIELTKLMSNYVSSIPILNYSDTEIEVRSIVDVKEEFMHLFKNLSV